MEHQGPLVLKSQERPMNRNTPSLNVLHWLALDPSDELLSILHINKATSFNEFATALTPFQCPSQNFAFASVNGDIGMFHQGRFPRKWNGQGRFILDGSEPGNDWSGWIAESESPRIKNPSQGWLYSANQSPTDSTYPYFLGNQFQNGVRARRLAQMLAVTQNATPENAFAMMLDDFDLHAFEILPFLLQKLVRSRLSSQDSTALKLLKAWNYRDGSTQVAPTLFNLWWQQLYQAIWHDEFGDDSLQYQWPSQDRTQNLIMEDEKSDWFDDISTPAKETLDFLITRSFREALELSRLPSKPKRDTIHFWKSWSTFRPVAIPHLAHIDAFSRLKISTGGCATCVNAMKPTHGPSWRMVVALDKMPRGRGIYPGGQSGNPGSPHYDDFISDWAAGRSYELNFLTSPGLSTRKSFSLQLRSK